MGVEAFRDAVEHEYEASRGRALTLPVEEIERVSSLLRPAAGRRSADRHPDRPAFARWRAVNVKPHKVPNRAVVVIPLKRPAPGAG
jgi:sulfite reductase (NADPH) hemoprotein beta-component